MTITQQQAREALERVYYATHASFIDRNLVRQYIEQSTAQPQAVVPSRNLLDAFKSGNAILIDWPMEPVTPQESLKLMDMMDAEYAKTMGKPAPDREMAVSMQRVQHMACDLWASQKEVIRAHFVSLAAARPSAQAEQAPVVQAVQATSEPLQRYTLRRPKDAADYMAKDSDGQWVKYDDLKADRASSGATTQAVRMLTTEEIADCCNGLMRDNSAIETWIRRSVKKAFAVNAGRTIPADGVIWGA